jgi:hypothetical protein
VQGSTCPKCGAALPPGATFCLYCGAAVGGSSAPLPSSGGVTPAPGFSPQPGGMYGTPPPAPQRRRGRVVLIVLLVVIILVVAVVAVGYFFFTPPVQVGYINIWAPDNVCGFLTNPQGNPVSYYGFNGSTGQVQTLLFPIPNFNTTTCNIVGAISNTSGFTLSDVQVPLAIPGNGTGSMNITITSPSSSFMGNLNLVFS